MAATRTSFYHRRHPIIVWALIACLLASCAPAAGANPLETNTGYVQPTAAETVQGAATEETARAGGAQPTQTVTAIAVVPVSKSTPADEFPAAEPPILWLSPALPQRLREHLQSGAVLPISASRDAANAWVEIPTQADWNTRAANASSYSYWIYALAAPFPTITDEISLKELQSAWSGRAIKAAGSKPLLMTAETRAILERFWGPAKGSGIEIGASEDLLDTAWERGGWAIIPFEEIQPRWKIVRIEGQSPLERDFDPDSYPLAVPFWIDGPQAGSIHLSSEPINRDPNKLTVLVMTGVTALSRHIGQRMEAKGITYPARDIGPLLNAADLTHISNEVSFYADCPTPGPGRLDMRFCSHPKYIELLEAVGTDIVELTGNHNLDWGRQPYLDTLEMYRQRGWGVYGGGANLEQARQPLLIEHNGNAIAFLGCSPSGPENVWAAADKPGSAPCDFGKLEAQLRELRQLGYLPVVTLQAIETDTYLPATAQGMPLYRRLARAGAVVVGGSQSHVPQTMTFVENNGLGNSFVHYGLGNLFFDQMEPPASRQQFIDRHIFYDGNYLGVELITTMLEDYSRPRLMTEAERASFLEKIFTLSDWSGPQP